MADFSLAYDTKVKPAEGYFALLAGDKGGMTYGGIARNFFPAWEGWPTVDRVISETFRGDVSKVPNNYRIPSLDQEVKDFFKANFWDANNMTAINSQPVAEIIFDWQVNSGARTANRKVQQLIGTSSDGIFGPKTIAAINAMNPAKLYNSVLAARNAFYASLPDADKFLTGWLNRLTRYFPPLPVASGIPIILIAIGAYLILSHE